MIKQKENCWHHYAQTFDGQDMILYVDGKEVLRSCVAIPRWKLFLWRYRKTAMVVWTKNRLRDLITWVRVLRHHEIEAVHSEYDSPNEDHE